MSVCLQLFCIIIYFKSRTMSTSPISCVLAVISSVNQFYQCVKSDGTSPNFPSIFLVSLISEMFQVSRKIFSGNFVIFQVYCRCIFKLLNFLSKRMNFLIVLLTNLSEIGEFLLWNLFLICLYKSGPILVICIFPTNVQDKRCISYEHCIKSHSSSVPENPGENVTCASICCKYSSGV